MRCYVVRFPAKSFVAQGVIIKLSSTGFKPQLQGDALAQEQANLKARQSGERPLTKCATTKANGNTSPHLGGDTPFAPSFAWLCRVTTCVRSMRT